MVSFEIKYTMRSHLVATNSALSLFFGSTIRSCITKGLLLWTKATLSNYVKCQQNSPFKLILDIDLQSSGCYWWLLYARPFKLAPYSSTSCTMYRSPRVITRCVWKRKAVHRYDFILISFCSVQNTHINKRVHTHTHTHRFRNDLKHYLSFHILIILNLLYLNSCPTKKVPFLWGFFQSTSMQYNSI